MYFDNFELLKKLRLFCNLLFTLGLPVFQHMFYEVYINLYFYRIEWELRSFLLSQLLHPEIKSLFTQHIFKNM